LARYHVTIGSALSAVETFDYLAMFSNAEHWDPGVVRARKISAGPVGPGSLFRLTILLLGVRVPLTYAITEYRRPTGLRLSASNWLLRSTDTIAVSDQDNSVSVSYLAEVTLRGPLRVFGPSLNAAFPRVAQRAVAGLSAALTVTEPRKPN
jgi:dehydrogenase/reductase SDR family member 12